MSVRQILGGLLLATLVVTSAIFVSGVHEEACPAVPVGDITAIESPIDVAAVDGSAVSESTFVATPAVISAAVLSGDDAAGTPLETFLRVTGNGPEGP